MKMIEWIKNLFSNKDNIKNTDNIDEMYNDTITPLMAILNWQTTISKSDYWKFYREDSFVYAPIKLISDTVTKMEYWVYKNWKLVEDKNIKLLTNHIMKSIASYLPWYWDAYTYMHKIWNTVKKLEVLNSWNIKFYDENGSTNKNPDFFEYKKGYKTTKLETKNLITMITFDPESDKRWIWWLEAWQKNILVLKEIDKWNISLLQNWWTIWWIFKAAKNLSNDERSALMRAFASKQSGSSNAGKNIVLSQDEEYTQMTQNLKDMDFTDLKKWSVEELLACFGVTQWILWKQDNLNYATLEAYREIFLENTIIPLLTQIQDWFNESDLFDWEFKFINIKNIPFEQVISLYSNLISTLNEARSMVWLYPIVWWDSIKLEDTEVKIKKIKDEFEENKKKKTDELSKIFSEFSDTIQLEYDKIENEKIFWKDEYFEKQINIIDSLTKTEEKSMISWINSIFDKQNKELTKLIWKSTNVKASKKIIDKYFKDSEEKYAVFFWTAMSDWLQETYQKGLNVSYKEFDDNGIKEYNKISNTVIKTNIDSQIDNISKVTWETSNKILNDELDKEKDNISDWTITISWIIWKEFDTFKAYRSELINRTEIIDAWNNAKLDVYQENDDLVEAKEWYTAQDERVCENCGPMNGKIIGLDDAFIKKGGKAPWGLKMWYKDIITPTLHPRCRCIIIPVLK